VIVLSGKGRTLAPLTHSIYFNQCLECRLWFPNHESYCVFCEKALHILTNLRMDNFLDFVSARKLGYKLESIGS